MVPGRECDSMYALVVAMTRSSCSSSTRGAVALSVCRFEAGLTGEVVDPSRPWLPPKSAFTGFRFPAEVIVVAVRWYLRYGLSY